MVTSLYTKMHAEKVYAPTLLMQDRREIRPVPASRGSARRSTPDTQVTSVLVLVAYASAMLVIAPDRAEGQGTTVTPPARGAVAVSPSLAPSTRDSLRSRIQRLVDSAGLASLTIGISVNGKTVLEEGFGYADIARKIPATPDTRYSLASISKPITATAVMQLVERGKLDLNAPANRYLTHGKLTGLAGSAESATIARVLSHTSGLPLHYRFYYARGDSTPGDGNPDVTTTVNRYGVLVYPPGTVYNYSNLGYGILGDIVASVSGVSYEKYLDENVFGPLGMTRSTVSTGANLSNSAVRYDVHHRPIPPYDFDHRGASAVYSTVNDILTFANFHLGLRDAGAEAGAGATPTLSAPILRSMQTVATPPSKPAPPATAVPAALPSGYGFGWFIDEDNGVRRVRHTGGMPGVNTVLAMYPDAEVAIVALANEASPLPGQIAAELAAAVMPDYAKSRTAAIAMRAHERVEASNDPPATFVVAPELRGTWRGTVRMYDRTVPLVLYIGDRDIRAQFGDAAGLWTIVNNASFQNDLLGGRFVGAVPTDDAARASHVVAFSLRFHDDMLRGWMAAQATGPRNNFSLSSYAELKRDTSGAQR